MKSGILPVYKPEGLSSARVVARVKKTLNARKVGHTGTLDPFATGLLLCAVNKGTRISRFFLDGHKQYTATVCLGVETDTHDKTGEVTASAEPGHVKSLDEEKIRNVVAAFSGVQEQYPPVYSALKHQGRPLYKLAREGKAVQKPARTIEIFKIAVTQCDPPEIDLDIHCSSGTYIRTIAHDIGRKLGCGAHLTRLCRTMSSQFSLNDAVDVDSLDQMNREAVEQKIVSLSDALVFLPRVTASPSAAVKISYGRPLGKDELGEKEGHIRVVDRQNHILALVRYNEKQQRYDYACVFAS